MFVLRTRQIMESTVLSHWLHRTTTLTSIWMNSMCCTIYCKHLKVRTKFLLKRCEKEGNSACFHRAIVHSLIGLCFEKKPVQSRWRSVHAIAWALTLHHKKVMLYRGAMKCLACFIIGHDFIFLTMRAWCFASPHYSSYTQVCIPMQTNRNSLEQANEVVMQAPSAYNLHGLKSVHFKTAKIGPTDLWLHTRPIISMD